MVTCAWIGPEQEWKNPYDPLGSNPVDPPIITNLFPDTTAVIPVNDSLLMAVEATAEKGYVTGYRWFFDGNNDSVLTSQGIYSRSWGITDTGMHQITVKALNEWNMVSEPKYFKVIVRSCHPYIIAAVTDTVVSQKAEVEKHFAAGDSNGGVITMYFWGSGKAGWDDSIAVKNSEPITKVFSNPDGGVLQVRWAARDDDGLFAHDTFTILFNRGPDSVWLANPATGDTAKFNLFNIISNTGRIICSFSSHDPDSLDTMTYTFLLRNAENDTVLFYQGRDTADTAENLSPTTTYRWQLSVKDLFGDSRRDSGEFITAPPPAPPEGMVLIQSAGVEFQMGQSGFDSSEAPIHTAAFSYHFWIDTTEVTQATFAAVMGTASEAAEENLPVVNISWFDAALYCNARSKHDGKDTVYAYQSMSGAPGQNPVLNELTIRSEAIGYRLPTEAEWEYACRIDSLTLFFWGNDYLAASTYAWTRENSDNAVHEVAQKKPNRFGLYDMAGNVWEWCNDWFDSRYYTIAPPLDPTGPQSGTERVIRGGSWKHSLYFSQAGTRSKTAPQNSSNTIGFRTVLVVR